MKPRLKKNFWRKIIVMNCAFMFFIIALFTAIRYKTNISAEKENVEDLLKQAASTTTSQFQAIFDEMARLSLNIAVSNTVKDTLKYVDQYNGKNNFFDVYREERRQLLQMTQQMAGSNIFDSSINIISAKGDYVLLDVYSSVAMNRKEMQRLSKMDKFQGEHAYKFIERTETDTYGRTNSPMFSYARKISDEFGDYGYVEIQRTQSSLDDIFKNSSNPFDLITIITLEGGLFYTSGSDTESSEESISILENGALENEPAPARLGRSSYLVYTTALSDYDFQIYTLMPENYYTDKILRETILLLIQSIFLLSAVLILVLLISRQIYRPVRELREKMEHLKLDDLKPTLPLSRDADEIELFNHVFANMIDRIQRQNDELIQQKIRELQVSYKALQAQVSPHFLYNTLYLIGLKGEEHNVPEILDMCSYLTHMMAYCVDMKTELVPFSSEIEYMENYLQLMKYRYLDKLRYTLEIGESVSSLLVPKFILQPLVENCFTHGFKNCPAPCFIVHVSLGLFQDHWTLLIEDNGNGFSKEDEQRISTDIQFVEQSIHTPNAKFVNEITGIGLINTYARLFISFSKKVTLKIGGSSLQGGLVEITCPIKTDA